MCSSSTPFKVWARQEGNCGASGAKSVGVITQWLAMMSVKVLLAVSREGAAALCAEFAVRIEDLGVSTSAFCVQRSEFCVQMASRPCFMGGTPMKRGGKSLSFEASFERKRSLRKTCAPLPHLSRCGNKAQRGKGSNSE